MNLFLTILEAPLSKAAVFDANSTTICVLPMNSNVGNRCGTDDIETPVVNRSPDALETITIDTKQRNERHKSWPGKICEEKIMEKYKIQINIKDDMCDRVRGNQPYGIEIDFEIQAQTANNANWAKLMFSV